MINYYCTLHPIRSPTQMFPIYINIFFPWRKWWHVTDFGLFSTTGIVKSSEEEASSPQFTHWRNVSSYSLTIGDSFNKVTQRCGRDVTPWWVRVGYTQCRTVQYCTVALCSLRVLPPAEALSNNRDLQFWRTIHTTGIFPLAPVCQEMETEPGVAKSMWQK